MMKPYKDTLMGWTRWMKLMMHKIFHWEYWPTWIVYFPCFIMYPYYAVKSRSSMFFTVVNPGIIYSGAFLTSKNEIYKRLPSDMIPRTLEVTHDSTLVTCKKFIEQNHLIYPMIVKPDMGLRGKGIKMIESESELGSFLDENDQKYLLQEFVNYDNEVGIFVIRDKATRLDITSIVRREFMTVVGDGRSTVEQLISTIPRYVMQLNWIKEQCTIDLSEILNEGQEMVLSKIGNHSKGTIFRNAENLNTADLDAVVQSIFGQFMDFNYGRLDIKYKSLEDLYQGKNFKIIELNGAFSEPAHIYDPEFRLLDAWMVLLDHFERLYRVSLKSIKAGYQPMTFLQGVKKIRDHFRLVTSIS